jgi:hypothetical protein
MLQKLFNLAGNSRSFDKMLKEIYWKWSHSSAINS